MSTTQTPVKVFGYVRGSTDEQVNTLAAQQDQIRAYCAHKGLDLQGFVIDQGESAFCVDFYERPKVQELLQLIHDHAATGIVITKLDRGFRNTVDCLLTVEDLKHRNIQLHLLDIGLDPNTPVGELLLTMLAAFARFENQRRSERQKSAFNVMANNQQRRGAVPFGWDAVPSERTSKTGRKADDLIPNPVEQAALKQILQWADEGTSDNEIARRINQAGIPTKNAGKIQKRNGKEFKVRSKWSGAQIRSVRQSGRLADPTHQEQAA